LKIKHGFAINQRVDNQKRPFELNGDRGFVMLQFYPIFFINDIVRSDRNIGFKGFKQHIRRFLSAFPGLFRLLSQFG
jgi:hypothetical protein